MDYAIGDIQGCYQPLLQLLEKIQFDDKRDRLWLVGDLVNRGPQSLQVLRFIKNLKRKPIVVLGNHDLHLLAVIYQRSRYQTNKDTFADILNAPDRDELCFWLRQQPLIYYDKSLNYVMSHAGISPSWSLEQALAMGQRISLCLQTAPLDLFSIMYGNEPSLWDEAKIEEERLRYSINALTRMRFCDKAGRLDLKCKAKKASEGLIPWFDVPNRKDITANILFGHWAALQGLVKKEKIYALDTGCVWGGYLTAFNLQSMQKFSVPGQNRF